MVMIVAAIGPHLLVLWLLLLDGVEYVTAFTSVGQTFKKKVDVPILDNVVCQS